MCQTYTCQYWWYKASKLQTFNIFSIFIPLMKWNNPNCKTNIATISATSSRKACSVQNLFSMKWLNLFSLFLFLCILVYKVNERHTCLLYCSLNGYSTESGCRESRHRPSEWSDRCTDITSNHYFLEPRGQEESKFSNESNLAKNNRRLLRKEKGERQSEQFTFSMSNDVIWYQMQNTIWNEHITTVCIVPRCKHVHSMI